MSYDDYYHDYSGPTAGPDNDDECARDVLAAEKAQRRQHLVDLTIAMVAVLGHQNAERRLTAEALARQAVRGAVKALNDIVALGAEPYWDPDDPAL